MKRLFIIGLILALCMFIGPVVASTNGEDLPSVPCPTDLGSCTANDITTSVIDIDLIPGSEMPVPNAYDTACDSLDDFINVRITADYSANADRHDLGVYVAEDGKTLNGNTPTASVCSGDVAPIPPFTNLDTGTGNDAIDTCGDIESKANVQAVFTATVKCNIVGTDLIIPSCRFWRQPGANDVCSGSITTDYDAGTGSKCDCTPFTVPAELTFCGTHVCNDNNVCTTDTCNEAAKACVYTPNAPCSDGNACTTDTCDPVKGCTYTPLSCDDSDACTTDGCDAATGCTHTAVVCDDSDACTTDSCDKEKGCLHTAVVCDDKSACTTDTCDPAKGCVYTKITCDDKDKCTTDTCDPASGCVFKPVTCDDEDECTDDTCDSVTGECVFKDNGECNPWCGLTIGYWKNNIGKYISGKNGRQVCDEFFKEIEPVDVCEAVTPDECADCDDWQCIYDRLSNPGGLEKNTIAQMTAMYLTGQAAAGGFEPFSINTDLYEPISCDDLMATTMIEPVDPCIYPECKDILEEWCGNNICDVGELWDDLQTLYERGELSKAQPLAECINEFNDECEWTDDSFDTMQCMSIESSFQGMPQAKVYIKFK